MDEIAGYVALGGATVPDRLCQAAPPIDGRVVLHAPLLHRDATAIIALAGKPRLDADPFNASIIAERVLRSYREHKQGCLTRLQGNFALAIVDLAANEALLAVDRFGIETLSWTSSGTALTFATSAGSAARSAGDTRLSPQALFDFMLGHMIAAPDTVYLGAHKLAAGTYLQLASNRVSVHRYWQPSFERRDSSIAELRDAVLPTIAAAIERCEPGASCGSFLSGGLDSSTVTGLLVRQRGPHTTAFSVGFGVDEFNELEYARIATRRFGCVHRVYEVVPSDVVELIPKIAAAYDEPFGNSSAVPTFCCARLAKTHGVDHLLAGDGGDELFGGNSRYVRQQVFEHYRRIPRALRDSVIEPFAALFDPESAAWPLRKLASYVRQARVPLPERFESWNMIYREGADVVFDRDFLATVDTQYPLRKMRELWESCPSSDTLDRMLWYDWKLTLADNDVRKVSRMCELAGVRVSYPMLDEDVVALSIRVPSTAKIAGNQLRAFFKQAVASFLPPEIIAKEKHGFGLPFGVWLKADRALQELVYESLDALKKRSIVSRGFIERIADEHRAGHASYYGYAIWDMVMLEQWLRRNVSAA